MANLPTGVVTRHLQAVIARRLNEEPVVVLNGARTVGKSTLLQGYAQAHGVQVLDLDDLATRQAVRADPAFFVSAPEPVCIDEFQHVLAVLDAIKAELNRDLRPGRYLLTGSTRYATLPAASQSLTGRAHVMTVWPFSQGELRGTRETFIAKLLLGPRPASTAKLDQSPRMDHYPGWRNPTEDRMAWDDVVEVAVATNDLGLTARYLPGETQALREDYYLRSHGSRRNRVQGPAEFPPVFGGLTSNALTVNDRYQGASVLNGTWSGPTSDVRHVWLDRQVDRVHAREGAG